MRLRHSLFWKLAGVLALFCLLLVMLLVDLEQRVSEATGRLPEPAKQVLTDYGRESEQAWRDGGPAGLAAFLAELRRRESVWAIVVDAGLQPLTGAALEEAERRRLGFLRPLDGSIGRPGSQPIFFIPFESLDARLVMELPERLNPRSHRGLWDLLLRQVIPVCLALMLGALLYGSLMRPLTGLRHQAEALSRGDLAARSSARMSRRKDELGELARSFDQMADRLESTIALQRQILRDMSHELRTPLARLRVAAENEQDVESLRQRLERELGGMESLIGDTLELVWLGTERPALSLEPIDVCRLWDVLREDACFESGWSSDRLPCELPQDCEVLGNLNGLARALENILRNAIRHSPEQGRVRLTGRRQGDYWHLWIEDEGPGVPEAELQRIFQPFARLNAARPGGDGFGLGLAISRSVVASQGGRLWAENATPGLRVHLLLPNV